MSVLCVIIMVYFKRLSKKRMPFKLTKRVLRSPIKNLKNAAKQLDVIILVKFAKTTQSFKLKANPVRNLKNLPKQADGTLTIISVSFVGIIQSSKLNCRCTDEHFILLSDFDNKDFTMYLLHLCPFLDSEHASVLYNNNSCYI